SPSHDVSPGTTGSSVFDFDGDGAAEVIYNDECMLRVYNGRDGGILWSTPSTSLTGIDNPIAVDVDNDGHTELVVVSGDFVPTPDAGSCTVANRHGVYVYADPLNRWQRTRSVWNQHSYHITNVKADLTLPDFSPSPELHSWKVTEGGFNNYRVSALGRNVAS